MGIEDIIHKVQDKTYKFNLFLGAGASVSSNMPLAHQIVEKILNDYKNIPSVERLIVELATPSYVDAVSALFAGDRKKLFENYIEQTHISITYLYIAELYKAGFIKYIFTTNFDDLVLRALAIKGIFPPIYDLTAIESLSSSKPSDGAIIFLHGRHNGDWQLNTVAEMDKVVERTKSLFNKIDDNRWLVVGYSGDDLVFNSLNNYSSRFDANLFWITYKDSPITQKLADSKLFSDKSKQAYYINGFDSDSFFQALYRALLDGSVPEILSKPFTTMSKIYEGVAEIDKTKYPKESLFLNMAKYQINSMIGRFEDSTRVNLSSLSHQEEVLQEKLMSFVLAKRFPSKEVNSVIQEIKDKHFKNLFNDVCNLYCEFSTVLYNDAVASSEHAIEKLKNILIKLDVAESFNNDDNVQLARVYSQKFNCNNQLFQLIRDSKFFDTAVENAKTAMKLNPEYSIVHYNLGLAYLERGNHFSHSNQEKAFNYSVAIEKLKNMLEISPSHIRAYEFLGICYLELSKINNKEANISLAIQYLKEGFEKGADNLILVKLYLDQNKRDEALSILEILYERNKCVLLELYQDDNLKPQYKVLEKEDRFKKLLSK